MAQARGLQEVRGEEDIDQELRSRQDEELKGTIGDLTKSRRALENISGVLKRKLELDRDRSKLRSWTAKFLHTILPNTLQENIPFLNKFIGEEYDALELLESLMKGNINSSQGALKKLSAIAIRKQGELEQLEADIVKAEKEHWDAQQLQDYLAKSAGVKIDKEIQTLLDKDFRGMSNEEKEQNQQRLIEQIKAQLDLGRQLVKTIEKVCAAGLVVFQESMTQYSAFMRVYRPIAVIRDSAKAFVSLNESMYAARDALMATLKVSLQAMALAVDAAKHVENYAITSPEMHNALVEGEKQLAQGIAELKEQQRTTIKNLKEGVTDKKDGEAK